MVVKKEEFEDTKGVIKIRKSKKDKQHNGQNKKYKRTNSDLPSNTQQAKDQATRTSLKLGMNSGSLVEHELFIYFRGVCNILLIHWRKT